MEPSTILFLAANPVRLQWLQLGEECRAIEDKIRAAKFRDQFRFRSRWAARPDDLLQALNEDNPSVLHFSGHGDGDQGLFFQAEDGSARSVSADALAKVMRAAGGSVVVVLLNACYSEMQAQALIAHVPCVIGISGALGDEAAVIYATSFYRALAFGKSVANAHEQGIAAFAMSLNGRESRDVQSPNTAQCMFGPRLLTRPDSDANCIYLVQRPTEKTRCTIIIKATLREFNSDVVARVTEELRQWTGDLSLQIINIDEGSVRLTVTLSSKAAKTLAELNANGQLTQLGGFRVTAVVPLGEAEMKSPAAFSIAAKTNQGYVGLYEQRFGGAMQVGQGLQPVAGFVDRYRLVRLIGTGGLGMVYEADDIKRGQKVALKTISNPDVEKIYQLKREFHALAGLSHPNLVALYDLEVAADSWFFTMELLDGVNLLTYLWGENPGELMPTTLTPIPASLDSDTDGDQATLNSLRPTPCDIDRLRHALPQLARGLHALHSAGKIHRDVKPSNILVTRDDRVVLLDFGLVTELEHWQGADGRIIGTVPYMAPEVFAGDVQPTAAVDWYAFGVVLFQALTGRLPFEGAPSRVLFEMQTVAAPRPSTLVQHLPRDLDDLCAELLEHEPANRPTGAQLLQRLGGSEPRSGAQD